MRFTSIFGMTTSSQPEPTRNAELLGALPRLPRGAGGPVFAEPWEAQAFALAVKLSEQVTGPNPASSHCPARKGA